MGGPGWTDTARFDIRMTTTNDTRVSEFREMLKSVLSERFHLNVVFETEERKIYRLVLVHADRRLGPTITVAKPGCVPQTDDVQVTSAPPAGPSLPCGGFVTSSDGQQTRLIGGRSVTMSELARTLSARQEIDRQVFDSTNLPGKYDFVLQVSPATGRNKASFGDTSPDSIATNDDLFSAMKEQLGVRLQSDSGPVRFLRITDIQRPTAD